MTSQASYHSDLPDARGQIAGQAKASASRRLYVVLAGLYLGQGIPNYLLLVALPPMMREAGASRTAIGLFALLMLPMVFKFAVAPLVDRYALFPRLGHRRSWVIAMQLMVSLGIAALAFVQPTQTTALFGLCFVIVLLFSLQDIATDGFAVRNLPDDGRAFGNAVQAGSIALGVIIGGTLSLVLFHHIGWETTILIIAALSLAPLLVVGWMVEGGQAGAEHRREPVRLLAFFKRPDAWLIFTFALSYRASEGLVKGMEGTYLVDLKIPTDWIGYLTGASAATAGLAGAMIAALIIRRFGLTATLILLGGLRTVCFVGFTLSAFGLVPALGVAMAASAFQTLIRYMELVAIYSFFMRSSSSDQPGTDFTILTCAELVIYLAGASVAGYLADQIGYGALFSLATLISVLGVWLAVWMLSTLDRRAGQRDRLIDCPP